jgi:predicted amidohydrolase YtcJ
MKNPPASPSTSKSDSKEWLLLENGVVHTLDDARPSGRSILMEGDRIAAVFDDPRPQSGLPDSRLRRVDLKGQTVVPAFTDSHIHFADWGVALSRVNLESARGAEETARQVAEYCRNAPVEKGKWVIGLGWSHNQWRDPNLPGNTALLDTLFPNNPVFLESLCGHLVWVNAAALRAAGLAADTHNPPGGEIARDPKTGAITGILKENAIRLVSKAIPPLSPDDRRKALRRATAEAHANGIVAVHAVEPVETFRLYQDAHREGRLDMRVNFYLPVSVLDEMVRAGFRSGLGDARLRIGGVKLFTDGSLGGRTAWMLEPYLEEPRHTGIPVLPVEPLREMVRKANENGLSCAIHAIGDRAVRETLQAYDAAWTAMGEAHPLRPLLRNRIEHFQTVHPDDYRYLKAMPIAACMQPVHLFADWRAADRFFGFERARRCYPCRSLAASGATLAFGSDAPVATVNVPKGLYAGIYRRDLEGNPADGWIAEERVSPMEGLKAYCSAPAEIALEQNDRGRIRPGLRADIAVLDADPLTASPDALRDAKVTATLFDGRWVHGEFE